MNITSTVESHCLSDFSFQVSQVGNGRGGNVRNAVGHSDQRNVFTLAEGVAGMFADNLGGCRTDSRRRGRRALNTGVHIAFVVIADVKHVVVSFEHAGQAAETDVGCTAVAALSDHSNQRFTGLLSLDACNRCHTGSDSSRVAEKRMEPGQLPAVFRIRGGEYFQTAGGVGGN